ncbi:hypothetical protein Barb6XT_02312 [Bacteroidales bacterium Barb6XT]|nr:hypothetical protein Barb6XT_02312 [Bacteroidales bacterium Barb6XT]
MGRNNNSDEVKKYRREFYSKFFGDLAKVIFTILVAGNTISLIRGSEDYTTDLIVFATGTFGTVFLVFIANKFIK